MGMVTHWPGLAAALFSEQGLWVVLLGVGLLLPFALGFYWLLKRGGRGRG